MDFQQAPVVVTSIEGGFRVEFVGPIHVNVAWIERELERVVAAKPQLVELDLAKTSYVSSMGLGVLVGLRNQITKAGGIVRIVTIDSRAFSVLKYANLAKLLNVEPTGIVHAQA